ncbi:AAA family ATPase [Chitinophaga sp. CC14]|uniref:AAA family ATPase n=1 Tax=Chitinophaga sp. CC14 TaxID=3029199 RepID=UPI003B7FFF96
MKISRLYITNIKSFKHDVFEFDQSFNIIVGPNASGKSNLLDIISMTLRKYFLVRHTFEKLPTSNKYQTSTPHFSGILDRFNNTTEDSEIEIFFVIKQQDIENIAMLQSITPAFVDFYKANFQNGLTPATFSNINWDFSTLVPDEVISFKIKNDKLDTSLTYSFKAPVSGQDQQEVLLIDFKKQLFLAYLNLYDYYSFYLTKTGEALLRPPYLFMGPYRTTTGPDENQSVLSTINYNQQILTLSNADSKTPSSLLGLATTYFSRKYLSMVQMAKEVGYLTIWDNDPEVKLVSRYLSILGYRWEMDWINKDTNAFEILLIKDGDKLRLNDASSGEKEIINYIFGIFAFRIANGIIAIDEPELHLHTRWQYLLLQLFKDLAEITGNQFFITTHSPVFIQKETLPNLIRIYKAGKESRHVSLNHRITANIKEHLHIINTTNNEKIFFADMVILVEGITDRLVFQKIVNVVLKKHDKLFVAEVVDIGGKHNIDKYRSFLDLFRIPNAFIADLDFVSQIKNNGLDDLFVTNRKKLERFVFTNGSSTDNMALIDILDEAITQNDLKALSKFRDYLKSTKQKLKPGINAIELKRIEDFTIAQRANRNYILSKGDIEDYLPETLSAKDLNNIIELLKDDEFTKWQAEAGYQLLEHLIEEILRNNGFIKE